MDGRNQLSESEHPKNNLPDVLERWGQRSGTERSRPCTAQSFCVPKADIEANGYDLSINRYKRKWCMHRCSTGRRGDIGGTAVAGRRDCPGMGVLEGC